jgi:hypothetical protein
MPMTDCMHTLLHSTGNHGSISTMEQITITTANMSSNVAVPNLSLKDVEKKDAELVLPSDESAMSNVGSLEDIVDALQVLNNVPCSC